MITWRCVNRSCKSTRSVRDWNAFFFHEDSLGRMNNKLSLCTIMEIVYSFLYTRGTLNEAIHRLGISKETVSDWYEYCRATMGRALELEPMMHGDAANPIQIDESYFSGRRKCGRGRLLQGDRDRAASRESDDIDEEPAQGYEHNYGDRELGPWVVGYYAPPRTLRYRIVADRTAHTLTWLTKQIVRTGSVVVTDEWRGYNGLSEEGYVHERVNHTENYVNPRTGYHTQGIERSWVEGKALMRHARFVKKIESHLDEIAWRQLHAGEDILAVFLRDTVRVHGTEAARETFDAGKESPSSELSTGTIKYGCLCDEPIRYFPHYAREKYVNEAKEKIAPINLWRLRHLEHSKICPNAKDVITSKREEILRSIELLRVGAILSSEPARLLSEKERAKRKRARMQEGSKE